jgi:DNA-binding transcriptional MerR regulator
MRQRLYLCDKYYQKYRELVGEYEEELRILLEANPERRVIIQSQDSFFISFELQKRIRKLAKDVLNLQEQIKNDGLLSLKTIVDAPTTFSNYFQNIYYWITDIRLIIFYYSRRYYTPATEVQFRDSEAAIILSRLGFPEADTTAIFKAESETDSAIQTELEKKLDETSKKNAKEEKQIREAVVKTIETKSGASLEDFTYIVDNTIVDLNVEKKSFDDKLDILADIAIASLGGGRRRKTRRTKKRSSKRRSRKH